MPLPDLPPIVDASPTNFSSPSLRKFVTELPRIPAIAATEPISLEARVVQHRYHPDLPATAALGYHDGILGPTIEATAHTDTRVSIKNSIETHPLGYDIDLTMHGAQAADKENPRITAHLHGGLTEPRSDGHPTISWRRGGVQSNRYGNRQTAATLWYHDHAMAITRLNVEAGLAGFYLLRDEYDTGTADNPLGLPSGEQETCLVIQDRTFNADGSLQPRLARFQPAGYNQLGQFGDVAVVNGVAWPDMPVRRGLHRFRVLQGSNSRTYRFEFSNSMPFWVIGTDQGLLDAPVETTGVTMTSGERVDILVDFALVPAGTSVTLVNTAPNSPGNTAFLVPTLRDIMRFDVQPGESIAGALPGPLLGRPGQTAVPTNDALQSKVSRTRNMTFLARTDFNRVEAVLPMMMSMNNLPFMSDDIDVAKAGTTELWRVANVLPMEHPVHIHLAKFKIVGRQRLLSAAYMAAHPVPLENDVRWNPDPSPFVVGPPEPAQAWESGWKDTTYVGPDSVLTLLVRWPSADEMGFDPDAQVAVPPDAETLSDDVRGYVWHCHNLEHEDHDMMQRIRVTL